MATESKANKFGFTDIFSHWGWNEFENFVGLYKAHYPTTDKFLFFRQNNFPATGSRRQRIAHAEPWHAFIGVHNRSRSVAIQI